MTRNKKGRDQVAYGATPKTCDSANRIHDRIMSGRFLAKPSRMYRKSKREWQRRNRR